MIFFVLHDVASRTAACLNALSQQTSILKALVSLLVLHIYTFAILSGTDPSELFCASIVPFAN